MENGVNSKIEMSMLFLQNCLMIFKEATRSLDEDECTALELFGVSGWGCDKASYSQSNGLLFGREIAGELKRHQ